MHEWLAEARDRIAAAVGDDASAYELSDEEVELLLALAGVAAHDSEQRTNAPLTTYLVGLARGRHASRHLAEVAAAAAGKSL